MRLIDRRSLAKIRQRPQLCMHARAKTTEQVRMKGTGGAAGVLAGNGALRIAMAGASLDVDTPEDWRRIRRHLAKQS